MITRNTLRRAKKAEILHFAEMAEEVPLPEEDLTGLRSRS